MEPLSPFSFLDRLHPSEWRELQKIAHPHRIKKDGTIFRANELSSSLYILLEGRVKITRLSKQGRELIQWFCLPGEIFGLARDSQGQRGLYAYALNDVKLLCIQSDKFDEFLLQTPRIALLIVKQLATRLRTLGDMLLNMTSEEAHVRFINLLKRLCDIQGLCETKTRQNDSGINVDIYLTHQEMADMIGVCRQTVSSMVGQLKNHGILESNRKGLTIKSPQMLEAFCLQPTLFSNPQDSGIEN